jgi:YfiH family protein
MEPPAPFTELGGQFVIDLPGARAVFTTRRGGVSTGPYASLNLGFATDDAPGAQDANRARVRELVGAPEAAWNHQVHSAEIGIVDDHAALAQRLRRDGHATRTPGIALGALGADCLTVAIAGGGAVAMVHAGWRGLAAGALAAGVEAVRGLGGPADEAGGRGAQGDGARLEAAVGPGAGACCYEVGPEVHEAFADHPEARVGDHLDLAAVARAQLTAAGVDAVHVLGLCTMCEPELFFSHRRDRGVTGRQAGIAWLT